MSAPTLLQCMQALAGVCDYAHSLDGQGFSGPDAPLGHELAHMPEELWTPRQKHRAWRMTRKYQRQLTGFGIDWEAIPEPPDPGPPPERQRPEPWQGERQRNRARSDQAAESRVVLQADEFAVHFSYNEAMVEAIREVPGRKYRDRVNYVPRNEPLAAAALLRFCERFNVTVGDDARAELERLAELAGPLPSPRSLMIGEDGTLEVRFPKDRRLIDEVKKNVPGVSWDQKAVCWRAPVTAAAAIGALGFAHAHGLEVTDTVMERVEQIQEEAAQLADASRATDADLQVDGLGGELYPFQRAGVAYALQAGRCFIADEMGLGKTVQALAVALARDAFPLVIVCPASLKLNWAREAARWVPGRQVLVLDGLDSYGTNLYRVADIIIVNYDLLRFETKPSKSNRRPPPIGHLAELVAIDPAAVVFDESQYVKNSKAIRTYAAKLLAKGRELVLLLTGTPLLNRPQELIAQLQVLRRLEEFGGFWNFARRYCEAYHNGWGLQMGGAANLEELNQKLRASCYVRRRKEEVLKELPAKRRAVIPLAIDNWSEYRAAERDAVRWFGQRAVAEEEFLASIEQLPADERREAIRAHRMSAEQTAARAEVLTKMAALKRLAARGKLEAAFEWIDAFLESGEKLVLFAHHREIVEAVTERYKCPSITGDTPSIQRQEAVDRFQAQPAVQLIVGNLRAMGTGLTLTAASNVAFLELAWTPGDHDQAEDRCHRIGQEESVTAWYLLAADTIDEPLAQLIDSKRVVVYTGTEGEEPPEEQQAGILAQLREWLEGRADG